jgi:hypothetical protein
MLQMVAAMRTPRRKTKNKYRVKKNPEWFRVKAFWRRAKKKRSVWVYVKAHWRTRSCWKL